MLTRPAALKSMGVSIPSENAALTPRVARLLERNRFRADELAVLRAHLTKGDRVLDLGTDIGVLATWTAAMRGIGRVVAVIPNPDLAALAAEVVALNGRPVEIRAALPSADRRGRVPFYRRTDVWASSDEPGDHIATLDVETIPLSSLVAEVAPTVIVASAAIVESGLVDTADFAQARLLVLPIRPSRLGPVRLEALVASLAARGFRPEGEIAPAGSVVAFRSDRVRNDAAPPKPAPAIPPFRSARPWLPADPRIVIATCMKDEGPFVLEWLAWHRAAGVTDFVIFTNDCTDGTDRLLDRLDAMGEVVHLPNPAVATGDTHFQPLALTYAHHLREVREADFFISMDVDEFLNVRTGDGRLSDLFAATGEFDVLSVTEVNHGSNRREHYERGWLTETFPLHQSMSPGRNRAHRGVKSIVRLSERVERLRNHRPDMRLDRGPVRWLDGSGRALASLLADRNDNGLDSRGTYGLVSLDHFALRSLDSYLVKMFRGDVVVSGKRVSQTYWRVRNRNEEATSGLARNAAAARTYHRARFESDPALMALHDAACAAHEARIAELLKLPEFVERRTWALTEAW